MDQWVGDGGIYVVGCEIGGIYRWKDEGVRSNGRMKGNLWIGGGMDR